jgi:hypothetical protein
MRARLAQLDELVSTDPRQFYATATRLTEDIRAFTADASLHTRCDVLLARLRASLYAPTFPDETSRRRDVDDVRALFTAAENGRSNRAAGSTGIALVLLAIAVTCVAAAPPRPFDTGVANFERGEYAAAVISFTQHVQDAPRDAAGWYNLGNSRYRGGDPGRAVWAWLKALQLEPRSGDARHNLALLNAGRASTAVQHWFPVSGAELALIAAACWWLALLSAAVHAMRRRPAVRIAGLLLATGCATALIMLGARWAGPGSVVPLARGADLYSGPTVRTDRRGTLDVGDAAEVVKREGDWLLVRTSDYREGWVRVSSVAEL